jgi:hypothetical protein
MLPPSPSLEPQRIFIFSTKQNTSDFKPGLVLGRVFASSSQQQKTESHNRSKAGFPSLFSTHINTSFKT